MDIEQINFGEKYVKKKKEVFFIFFFCFFILFGKIIEVWKIELKINDDKNYNLQYFGSRIFFSIIY